MIDRRRPPPAPPLAPTLPPPARRPATQAFADPASTRLGRRTAERAEGHGDQSGLHLLRDGKSAFAARALLARAAERALDVQYYIWHNDLSGSLMLDELVDAANRGVRVRLLLDDNGVRMDRALAALDAHPLIEVRLFNPAVWRRARAANLLVDFHRLNRRMHAKSFTADGAATIIGGRNVGDEYFGARDDGLFVDLDALCLGPVVAEVGHEFDRHWDSPLAVPVARLLAAATPRSRTRFDARRADRAASDDAQAYRRAVDALPLFGEVEEGQLEFTWADTRLIADDPARAGGADVAPDDVWPFVQRLLTGAERRLTLISGYFVPTACGVTMLDALAGRGVDVRVLSNSYASTDVGAVHAGSAKARGPLLAAGVRLFEMPSPDDKPRTARKFVSPGGRSNRVPGTTLHAKAFAADGERLFVGSFNLDPRSARLNTELGIAIDSPEMAREFDLAFDRVLVPNSYRLLLDDGAVAWCDARDDRPTIERVEPGTTVVSRALTWLLARLPIEGLL